MWKWYNLIITLMFVVGFTLIGGSLIYLIIGLEKMEDNSSQENESIPSLQSQKRGDSRRPSRYFSDASQQRQEKKNSMTGEEALMDDFEALRTDVEAKTETVPPPENSFQEQLTDSDLSNTETSKQRKLYIQKRLRQAETELPLMISEWKRMKNNFSTLTRTLPFEEMVRILPDYRKNLKQVENEILRLAFDYLAITGEVETLNAMFEGTRWSFE